MLKYKIFLIGSISPSPFAVRKTVRLAGLTLKFDLYNHLCIDIDFLRNLILAKPPRTAGAYVRVQAMHVVHALRVGLNDRPPPPRTAGAMCAGTRIRMLV